MRLVLVVEDDTDAQEATAEALRRFGYEVVGVGTLGEARSFASRRPPDVVVLDCRLPDGDGLELAQQWSTDPQMKEVPIIVLSGFSARQDLEAALLAGADAFLVKPCTGALLAAHLDRMFAGLRPSRTLRLRPA